MNKKTSLNYITILKGVACFFMMISHYFGIIRYSTAGFQDSILYRYLKSPFSFVLDGDFWLYLFLVISGFLVAHSSIDRFSTLIKKCFIRFLRFAFPVFFAAIIIYAIQLIIGFQNNGTITAFCNDWFQKAYSHNLDLKDIIFSPIKVLILGDVAINSPYWVLRHMMIASFYIYFISYIRKCTSNKNLLQLFLSSIFALIPLILSPIISPVIFACTLGAYIHYYQSYFSSFFSKNRIPLYLLILLSLSFYLFIINSVSLTIFFCLILITFITTPALNINSSILQFLGKISFGIYSFHWPIICSIGAYIMLEPGRNSQFGLN